MFIDKTHESNFLKYLYDYDNLLITKIDFGIRDIGEKNFINDLYNPYEDYIDEPFPSGEINNIKKVDGLKNKNVVGQIN